MASDQLPEGTDTVITGAGVDQKDSDIGGTVETDEASASGSHDASGSTETTGGEEHLAFFDRVEALRGQATDQARDLAQAGKDRAASALDNLVQTVEDAAAEIDAKLGAQYGDYARRAAQGIGTFSSAVRDKDVDDLFNDARALVAKSPAIAVGAAAAIGFVVARLARAALPDQANTDTPRS